MNAGGTLLFRLGSVYQHSQSIVRLAPTNERLMVQPSLTWQPNDRFSVTLLSHFQDDDMGVDQQFLPEIGTALPNPNGQLPRSTYVSDNNFDSFKRNEYHVGYVADFKVNDWIKFHQGVRKSNIDVEMRMLYGAGYFEDAEQRMWARYLLLFDENQNNLATDTSLQLDFGTGALEHRLLAGVDYRETNGPYRVGFSAGAGDRSLRPGLRADVWRRSAHPGQPRRRDPARFVPAGPCQDRELGPHRHPAPR